MSDIGEIINGTLREMGRLQFKDWDRRLKQMASPCAHCGERIGPLFMATVIGKDNFKNPDAQLLHDRCVKAWIEARRLPVADAVVQGKPTK